MTAVPASRRRPDGRYDEPSLAGQRVLAVLLGVLFVAVLVAVFFALYDRFLGQADVRGKVQAYSVTSDAQVVVDIEVSKAAGGLAYCIVRARGQSGLEVGRDVAVLDAVGTSERTARGEFALATTSRAVTGEVGRCTDQRITREDVVAR